MNQSSRRWFTTSIANLLYLCNRAAEKDLTTKDTKVTKEEPKELTAKSAKEDLKESLRSLRALRFDAFTQHDLLSRAADYFAQARKPRAEWKKLEDLAAQLAEFDLRCAASDYDTAASVLTDIDFDYLLLWGHYRLMIEMYEKIQAKTTDKRLRMFSLNSLGTGYCLISQVHKAIRCFQDAKEIAVQLKDRSNESGHLGNLGNVYADLGDAQKAIEFYEQALVIAREIGNQEREGVQLSNLASRYFDLGENDKCEDFYNEALQNARKIGNQYGEGKRLNGLARVLIEKGDLQSAMIHLQESLKIGQEISSPEVCNESGSSLAQAYVFQNDLVNARATIEAALQYDVPENNHNASALHGFIALRQGDASAARQSFTRAIAQADEILTKTPEYYSALDAKGLSICGVILCRGAGTAPDDAPTNDTGRGDPAPTLNDDIETFCKAREIAPHAGVVKSVLRLFDELVKCDEEGILKDVRDAVQGM